MERLGSTLEQEAGAGTFVLRGEERGQGVFNCGLSQTSYISRLYVVQMSSQVERHILELTKETV